MNTDQASGSTWESAVDPVIQPVAGSRHESAGECESGTHADAIEFRIERPGTPAQRLRLTGHRYTLGSAEGCSIRLHDPGLRPMHAVMIRENGRLVVRAYSVPIEINDVRITEAELHPGDVLRLGGYRFELLCHGSTDTDVSRVSGEFHHAGTSPDAPKAKPAQPEKPAMSEAEIAEQQEAWREREEACQLREQLCEQREAKLSLDEADLQARSEAMDRREERLQAEESATADLHVELVKRQQELDELQATHQQQHEKHTQREAELQSQVSEYQQRVDEASRKLKQSQQEADEASRSVEEMREQFDSLQQQLEELSQQQTELEVREQQQRIEHEELVSQLEEARDQAIAAQAESDSHRREAESKLEELESLIESLEKDSAEEREDQQAKLADRERSAEALKQQVQELQQNLNDVTQEHERLQAEHEQSLTKVAELEALVSLASEQSEQASEQSEQDRQDLLAETHELRSTVDRLSAELDKAIGELSQLREANAALTARCDLLQAQRDEACDEADSRPTLNAYRSLQEDFAVASQQLSQVQQDYQALLDQLDSIQQEQALISESSDASDANWNRDDIEPYASDADQDAAVQSEDHTFANRLIRDLDEAAAADHLSHQRESAKDEAAWDEQEPESSGFDWDQERREEAYATEWSNTTNGDRIENIHATDSEDREWLEQPGDQDPSNVGTAAALDDSSTVTESEQRLDDMLSNSDRKGSTEESADDEEDSIEAYMNRLLRRVQGKPLDELPQQTEVTIEPSKPQPKSTKTERPVANKLASDEPLRPRSQAPERVKSLSAMRELANSSAQSALSRSLRLQTRDTQIKGAISFACAGGAVICGTACYLLLPGQLRFVAVAMTSLVALIYAREGWMLFREASRRLRAASLGKLELDEPRDSSDES